MTGYRSAAYADSFSGAGTPRRLEHCGGWIIERPIPGSPHRDAAGCYPIFCCRDWSRLHLDLAELPRSLVSLTIVTDPFGNHDRSLLKDCFDLVRPYKQHFVTDLGVPVSEIVTGHHRRNVARARRMVTLDTCEAPLDHLDDWVRLYRHLVRHRVLGEGHAFGRDTFARQLAAPGLVMFRAKVGDEVAGLHLWYVDGGVAYGHLGATSELGYRSMAAYALYWYALSEFARGGLEWLGLGASPGLAASDDDGLAQFKRGWATGTREVHLCGRILDRTRYAELAAARGIAERADYFPAYRAGEFANPAERQADGAVTDG